MAGQGRAEPAEVVGIAMWPFPPSPPPPPSPSPGAGAYALDIPVADVARRLCASQDAELASAPPAAPTNGHGGGGGAAARLEVVEELYARLRRRVEDTLVPFALEALSLEEQLTDKEAACAALQQRVDDAEARLRASLSPDAGSDGSCTPPALGHSLTLTATGLHDPALPPSAERAGAGASALPGPGLDPRPRPTRLPATAPGNQPAGVVQASVTAVTDLSPLLARVADEVVESLAPQLAHQEHILDSLCEQSQRSNGLLSAGSAALASLNANHRHEQHDCDIDVDPSALAAGSNANKDAGGDGRCNPGPRQSGAHLTPERGELGPQALVARRALYGSAPSSPMAESTPSSPPSPPPAAALATPTGTEGGGGSEQRRSRQFTGWGRAGLGLGLLALLVALTAASVLPALRDWGRVQRRERRVAPQPTPSNARAITTSDVGLWTMPAVVGLEAREPVPATAAAEFRRVFHVFDKDTDNAITLAELGAITESIGHASTSAELARQIAVADLDSSGDIDVDEFLTMMARPLNSHVQPAGDAHTPHAAVFRLFDTDGNGVITAEELQKAMAPLHRELTAEEAAAMLNRADTDGSGNVTRVEFDRMLAHHGQNLDQALAPPNATAGRCPTGSSLAAHC